MWVGSSQRIEVILGQMVGVKYLCHSNLYSRSRGSEKAQTGYPRTASSR